jgi:hypothetical protein
VLAGVDDSTWDARDLPFRNEEDIVLQLEAIEDQSITQTLRQTYQQRWGINERCALTEIPSISLTTSFPHEWMHLLLENNAKNMIALWTGKFKGLDVGQGEFRIVEAVWNEIGAETAKSGSTIPSTFGRCTPNIATESHIFTAEDWAFFMVELAPHLLRGRFPQPKYYKHFMIFNKILRISLQFTITKDDLQQLEELIVQYVEDFERCACIPYVVRITSDMPKSDYTTATTSSASQCVPSLYTLSYISATTSGQTVRPATTGAS